MPHGARVYVVPHRSGSPRGLIKQTVLRQGKYVRDEDRERHVWLDDDAAVGRAVRDALAGLLPVSQRRRLQRRTG